jgi:hypothetical protein
VAHKCENNCLNVLELGRDIYTLCCTGNFCKFPIYHSAQRPFCMMADRATVTSIQVFLSGTHVFCLNALQLVLDFYSPYSKMVLEMVSDVSCCLNLPKKTHMFFSNRTDVKKMALECLLHTCVNLWSQNNKLGLLIPVAFLHTT